MIDYEFFIFIGLFLGLIILIAISNSINNFISAKAEYYEELANDLRERRKVEK